MGFLVVFMIWIIQLGIMTFWLVDILNVPFMDMFDVEIPLNGLFWLLFYIVYIFNMTTMLGIGVKKTGGK